jgi:hypothetical protein
MTMNIDWSKQPEGFPLWLEGTNENHRQHSGWYRERGPIYEGAAGGQWRGCREGQFFTVHRKPEWPQWNGEGKPPVGLEVEARFPKSILTNWTRFKLMYLSDQVLVYKTVNEVACEPAAFELQCVEFRPLRTPEQIAAEERQHAIDDLADELGGHPDAVSKRDREMAAYLYDQGYRKQPTDQ